MDASHGTICTRIEQSAEKITARSITGPLLCKLLTRPIAPGPMVYSWASGVQSLRRTPAENTTVRSAARCFDKRSSMAAIALNGHKEIDTSILGIQAALAACEVCRNDQMSFSQSSQADWTNTIIRFLFIQSNHRLYQELFTNL